MAVYETHNDDEALATGTHKGADGASALSDPGADFKSCGINSDVGQAVSNETQATSGNVTASTEDTVTDDGNSWDNGDTYKIYKTAAKDTFLSRHGIDKSRGWKATKKGELNAYGWRPEDADIDVDESGHRLPHDEIPFGPGQPEHKGR